MKASFTAFVLLTALCCQCAPVRPSTQESLKVHRRNLKLLGWLFGDEKDEESQSSSSSSSVTSSSATSSSGSSSSFVTSGTASTSTSTTATSSKDSCGKATTTSTSSGNAQSLGSASVSGVDCGAEAESEAVSKGEETAIAAAEAVAEKGKFAQAIAKSIGSGDGVDVLSTAIAEAVEEGEGDAVALAIAATLGSSCEGKTQSPKCPQTFAPDAIVEAFALADNSASGSAYAEALAYGLVYDDSQVQSIFVKAVSKILRTSGCSVTKPLLADARAFAVNLDKDVEFVTTVDTDIKVSQCFFEKCTGALLQCCSSRGDTCVCTGDKDCKLDLLQDKPRKIWSSSTETCACK